MQVSFTQAAYLAGSVQSFGTRPDPYDVGEMVTPQGSYIYIYIIPMFSRKILSGINN